MASSPPVGLVGLELHGRDALLRSLVVDPNSRTNGIGSQLVEHAENYARARGVDSIYLLTTGKITVLVGV
jgi:amino-acid N-acetyltransferase